MILSEVRRQAKAVEMGARGAWIHVEYTRQGADMGGHLEAGTHPVISPPQVSS